jgi:hypothetical protein
MKIRIQDSDKFVDINVEHPNLLGNLEVYERELKPKLQEIINRDNLKCSGCGKLLKERDWICVSHRPMSAGQFKEISIETKKDVLHYLNYELKDVWALFLFCSDTRESCLTKWNSIRPK